MTETGDYGRLGALADFIAEELGAPLMPEAADFAAELARRPGVAAVLFYGSCLQKNTVEGLLDFYVLTDARRPYGQGALEARAGSVLPPNVYHETFSGLRAKVAVVSMTSFRARMEPDCADTTFWARFCQRAALASARDEAARLAAIAAVSRAVETGAVWASRLASDETGAAAWRALFSRTYGAELRVEAPARGADIISADEARFVRLWELTAPARAAAPPVDAEAEWARRSRRGKLRNAARLVKAAFTFKGGFDYAVWKVERHSGRPVEISPWQRRWPWLAAPLIAFRLWRERRLR